ncbi:MAG: iron hydrogenase, partial [Bacteroidota bacterium]
MSIKNPISRRDFIRWAVAAPVGVSFLDEFLPKLAQAMQEAVKEYPIIWLQASTCSGCSVSVINTIHPSIKNVILEQVLPGHQLLLMYHGTLMAATGSLSLDAARETALKYKGKYVFVVEGSIPTKQNGVYGSLGEKDDKPIT